MDYTTLTGESFALDKLQVEALFENAKGQTIVKFAYGAGKYRLFWGKTLQGPYYELLSGSSSEDSSREGGLLKWTVELKNKLPNNDCVQLNMMPFKHISGLHFLSVSQLSRHPTPVRKSVKILPSMLQPSSFFSYQDYEIKSRKSIHPLTENYAQPMVNIKETSGFFKKLIEEGHFNKITESRSTEYFFRVRKVTKGAPSEFIWVTHPTPHFSYDFHVYHLQQDRKNRQAPLKITKWEVQDVTRMRDGGSTWIHLQDGQTIYSPPFLHKDAIVQMTKNGPQLPLIKWNFQRFLASHPELLKVENLTQSRQIEFWNE